MGLILDELYNYCDRVKGDTANHCKKYRWACLRFMRDADRIGKWQWKFNEEKAALYLNTWMPIFKHSKGPLAGKPKIPNEYERFVYGNVYGWDHVDTELRRFRRMYEQLARKNAKSQDKAIQCLFEASYFGESNAEVYIAATKKEQTRHVWAEADWIAKHSDLKDEFSCKYDRDMLQVIIRHKGSGSFISRLSKDDKRSGDGSNPHFVVIDEYHLHDTTEYYDLATSGQKTREQPLLSIITTAGFDLTNPCYRVEYDYVSKILDPDNPVENDRYFVAICEIDRNDTTEAITVNGKTIAPGEPVDDIRTIEAIRKSNPILGTSDVGIESIKIEVDEALDKPEKMRDVLTKTFNFWVNQRDAGYMDMSRWSICGESDAEKLPDVSGIYKFTPFGCFDLASTIDLCSSGFVFNLPNGMQYVKSHSFMPEEMIKKASDRDHVRYDLWVSQGWITATPGAEVDYHLVLEWFLNQYKINNWGKGEVCFDKHLATWLTQELEKKGFTPVEIPQSYTGLSLATKEFRAKVYNRKIIHENDPVLNWAMGNCVIRCGPSENIMLDKSAARFRIDPVAALINGMVRAIANETKENVYDKRGMREL